MLTKAYITDTAEAHGFTVEFIPGQGGNIRVILGDEESAESITFNIWPDSTEANFLRGIIAAREIVGRPVIMN